MEQTVQVGLVFPRSGQQLFVYVPARYAESVQKQYSDGGVPHANTKANPRNTRFNTESDAHR